MVNMIASLCAYLFVKLIHHVSASVVRCVCCVFEVHGVIAVDYDILLAISSFQETVCPIQRLLPLLRPSVLSMVVQGPWESRQGLDRLQDLPAEHEDHPVPTDPDVFIDQMRDHAEQFIDGELLDERQDLWEKEWATLKHAPPWWTFQPPDDLRCWADVILKELKVSDVAAHHFVALVKQGPEGFSEGLRVLAHLVKDKKQGPGDKVRDNASAWMTTACLEAQGAVQRQRAWVSDPGAYKGPAKGAYAWANYRPSSSSWCHEGPGKGHDKGPDKGHDKGPGKGPGKFHQGLR